MHSYKMYHCACIQRTQCKVVSVFYEEDVFWSAQLNYAGCKKLHSTLPFATNVSTTTTNTITSSKKRTGGLMSGCHFS